MVDLRTLSNDQALERVDLLTKSAKTTCDLHRCKIRTLTKHDIRIGSSLLADPQLAWDRIRGSDFVNADVTAIAYMRTMMCVGYAERLTRATHEKEYDSWREFLSTRSREATRMNYDTSQLADTTKNMPLDEIKRRVLAATAQLHMEKVIVAMYTFIPPCRLDYGSALIHTNEPASAETTGEGNHVVIGGSNPRVVLNEYKTSRQYGQIVNSIPNELLHIIVASLRLRPRKYIFGNKPVVNFQSSRITNASHALLGVRLSCNDYRRIYASSVDASALTNEEHARFARQMGHSAMTSFTKYRRLDLRPSRPHNA